MSALASPAPTTAPGPTKKGQSSSNSSNNTQNQNNNSNTLDNRHSIAHAKLVEEQERARKYEDALSGLDAQLATYVERGLSNLTDAEFLDYQTLDDRCREMEAEIVRCKACESEVEYMLDTADIIFKYYDIIEHGDGGMTGSGDRNSNRTQQTPQPSEPSNPPPMQKHQPHPVRENSILKYFMKTAASGDAAGAAGPSSPQTKSSKPATVKQSSSAKRRVQASDSEEDADDVCGVVCDRASLLDMYLEKTDPNHFKSAPYENFDACQACGHIGRTVLPNDGMCFCNSCHAVETVLIDHEKPSYKDPPKEITYFAYKRINHLNEWISQIQGKESTEIPPEIYDKILLEIRKQRITNMADVTNAKIREILKKLGQNRFYEHGAHIMNRLNGMPSISLTPEIEDKLRQMFKMIQIPFFKHAPRNRKNFLSYSYTLHKCLQLLELDEYLKYFPLLKSREKTHAMDEVWKKICADLSWHFYPSV